jgi:CheY-like chemotaxis protein
MADPNNNRILIVDNNADIHDDFVKILISEPEVDDQFRDLELELFSEKVISSEDLEPQNELEVHLSHAYQGAEAYQMFVESEASHQPFALIFMDLQMPPGWNGIKTINKIWSQSARPKMVMCHTFSDLTREEIANQVLFPELLKFLKKPFDFQSVQTMVRTLLQEWNS